MEANWMELAGWAVSVVTGLAGWFGGRLKHRNEVLQAMQSSISLLAVENSKLLEELTIVKKQNYELVTGQSKMQTEIKSLRHENETLRKQVTNLTDKLEGIKTITKVK